MPSSKSIILIVKIILYTLFYIFIVWNFSMNEYEKNIVKNLIIRIHKIGEFLNGRNI